MQGHENFSPIQTPGGELFVPKHIVQDLEVANASIMREATAEYNAKLKPNEQLGSLFAESTKDKLEAQQQEERERSLESLHQALSNPDEVSELSKSTSLLERALPKTGRSEKRAASLAAEVFAEQKGYDVSSLPKNLVKDLEKVARTKAPLASVTPKAEQISEPINATPAVQAEKPVNATPALVVEKPQIPILDTSAVRKLPETPVQNRAVLPEAETATSPSTPGERSDIWSINDEPAEALKLPEPAAPKAEAPVSTPVESTIEETTKPQELPAQLDGLDEWWTKEPIPEETPEATTTEMPAEIEHIEEKVQTPTPEDEISEEPAPEESHDEPTTVNELPAIHDDESLEWWDGDTTPTQLERPTTLEDEPDIEAKSPGKILASLRDEYKASDRSKEFIEKHKDELYDQLITVYNELNDSQVVFEDLDDWEFSKAIELFGDSLEAMFSYSTDERVAEQQKLDNNSLIAEITKRWFDAKYPPTAETTATPPEADTDDDDEYSDFKPDGSTTTLTEEATGTAIDEDGDDFTDFVPDNVDDEPATPTDTTTVLPGVDPGLIAEAKPATETEKRQRRAGKFLSKIINETGIWNLSRGDLSAAYNAGVESKDSTVMGAIANRAGNALSGAASLVENQRNRSRNRLYSQIPSSNKPATPTQEISPEDTKELEEYLSTLPASARAELEKLPKEVLVANNKRRQTRSATQKPQPTQQSQSEAEQKGLARRALGAAQATRQRNLNR